MNADLGGNVGAKRVAVVGSSPRHWQAEDRRHGCLLMVGWTLVVPGAGKLAVVVFCYCRASAVTLVRWRRCCMSGHEHDSGWRISVPRDRGTSQRRAAPSCVRTQLYIVWQFARTIHKRPRRPSSCRHGIGICRRRVCWLHEWLTLAGAHLSRRQGPIQHCFAPCSPRSDVMGKQGRRQ